jgi:3-oxoacyl-[acyl-carrier protein] reductase
MTEARPLAGRRCLLTGAAGALGAATARALRRQGADLLLVGRREAPLRTLAGQLASEAQGGGALEILAIDLADDDAPGRVARRAAEGGALHVLINNAAVQGPIGPLWETDWDEWRACLAVNLLAPVALCRALAPRLGQTDDGVRGKIINLSGGGATGPRANFSAYGVAKAGLARFTETLALEVAGLGVDVNAVAPGVIASNLTRAVLAAGAERGGVKEVDGARRALADEGAASGRDAADLIAWLASGDSDGVTGRLISAVWDPWRGLAAHKAALAASDIYTLRRITPEDRGCSW